MKPTATSTPKRVLVAGARGFIGRALVPALEHAGHHVVRGMRPSFDVDDDASVARALEGVDGIGEALPSRPRDRVVAEQRLPPRGADVAVWLIHGLNRASYTSWERDVATRFGRACANAGVSRIVYLGGPDVPGENTVHLASRKETGRALRDGGVDVVELRAGMIIGAGGESWTLARDAAARLLVFIAPPWLFAKQQPVALDDVIAALAAACARNDRAWRIPAGAHDVPGVDVVTGAEIVERVAAQLGRRQPRFVKIPAFPKRLAGRIAPYVTRAHGRVARELFVGMGLDFTMRGDGVFAFMPEHARLGFDEAVARALAADDVGLGGSLLEAAVSAVDAVLGGARSRTGTP